MTKSNAGFTLVESLLVLGIVLSLLYVPFQRWERWQAQLTGEYFFRQFERQLLSAQQMAISVGNSTQIIAYRDNPEIALFLITPDNKRYEDRLIMPSSITSEKKTQLIFRPGNGNVDKIMHFSFVTTYSDEPVIFQIYLGSGRFERK